jgi:hypothetical protein
LCWQLNEQHFCSLHDIQASRKRKISCVQQNGRRLTELVTSCTGTADYNTLLKKSYKDEKTRNTT